MAHTEFGSGNLNLHCGKILPPSSFVMEGHSQSGRVVRIPQSGVELVKENEFYWKTGVSLLKNISARNFDFEY